MTQYAVPCVLCTSTLIQVALPALAHVVHTIALRRAERDSAKKRTVKYSCAKSAQTWDELTARTTGERGVSKISNIRIY